MNRWEVGTATASGIAFAAAGALFGVPALMHHGKIPNSAWLAGTAMFLVACVLFAASVVVSVISTRAQLRRHRQKEK